MTRYYDGLREKWNGKIKKVFFVRNVPNGRKWRMGEDIKNN